MKKTILFAAAGMMAFAAQAQYTVDPSTSEVVKKNPKTVEYIVLSDAAVADLTNAGAKVTYIGPSSEEGRNLWYWENTFIAGDESNPRVDMEEGGYISVEVAADQTWSGAGLAVDAPGLNLSNFNDDTMFHIAYMTPTNNGPASIALILLDDDKNGSKPCKVALGDPFNDNGPVYPSVGPKINDEWQGVEISFANLRKLYPSFSPANLEAWKGNLFCWLGGAVAGQTMAFDAVYFYNTETGGVEGAENGEADFVVTGNTVNVMGANGIQLYNLAGQLVKSTEGTTIGLNGLAKGIYVAKAANKARKIVVR